MSRRVVRSAAPCDSLSQVTEPNRRCSSPNLLTGGGKFSTARREMAHLPGLDLVLEERDTNPGSDGGLWGKLRFQSPNTPEIHRSVARSTL